MTAPDVPLVTHAPGKLYIAGEYAVVQPGHPALLVAVDRGITVTLTEAADAGRVHSRRWGPEPVTWVRSGEAGIVTDHGPLDYVMSAIGLMERLRSERGIASRYFDLLIESELDDDSGRKFGLGSSGAVTVAVVEAVGLFCGMDLSPHERFRLALLATLAVSPRASGGDLAASTFGGWICYTAPDRSALRARMAGRTVEELLTAPEWADCRIERLPAPAALRLHVGWTGTPASTEQLVDRISSGTDETDTRYADFLAHSAATVADVRAAWGGDPDTVIDGLRRCRRLLQELGTLRGTLIETEQLRLLCDLAEAHGAAGKPSGAGGGDCGIVLMRAADEACGLLRAWEDHGILPLRLSASPALHSTAPRTAVSEEASREH
ncbi:phosphomevalonate kinase [Brevibacterium album]|uniref:phosphomevalonate kinase n=1 Tax=Brevibacterium album TaxID=417948 RepID=UPI0004186C28|nr:phosphomevalonate kinase [Brevibacterium album]